MVNSLKSQVVTWYLCKHQLEIQVNPLAWQAREMGLWELQYKAITVVLPAKWAARAPTDFQQDAILNTFLPSTGSWSGALDAQFMRCIRTLSLLRGLQYNSCCDWESKCSSQSYLIERSTISSISVSKFIYLVKVRTIWYFKVQECILEQLAILVSTNFFTDN